MEKAVELMRLPAPEPGVMLHVTPLFDVSLLIVAVISVVLPAATIPEAAAAETDTVIDAGAGAGGDGG